MGDNLLGHFWGHDPLAKRHRTPRFGIQTTSTTAPVPMQDERPQDTPLSCEGEPDTLDQLVDQYIIECKTSGRTAGTTLILVQSKSRNNQTTDVTEGQQFKLYLAACLRTLKVSCWLSKKKHGTNSSLTNFRLLTWMWLCQRVSTKLPTGFQSSRKQTASPSCSGRGSKGGSTHTRFHLFSKKELELSLQTGFCAWCVTLPVR